jgi:hypothetical protein
MEVVRRASDAATLITCWPTTEQDLESFRHGDDAPRCSPEHPGTESSARLRQIDHRRRPSAEPGDVPSFGDIPHGPSRCRAPIHFLSIIITAQAEARGLPHVSSAQPVVDHQAPEPQRTADTMLSVGWCVLRAGLRLRGDVSVVAYHATNTEKPRLRSIPQEVASTESGSP